MVNRIVKFMILHFHNEKKNEKILVIGDSLDNDIKGANLQNLDSLLITSGIHREVNNHNGVDKEELNDLIKKKICPKFIMRHLTFKRVNLDRKNYIKGGKNKLLKNFAIKN